MKTRNKTIHIVLLCVLSLIANAKYVPAQERQDEVIKKIIAFLNTNEELRNYSKSGYTSTFSGDFRPIPSELQIELNTAFPEYKFYIAKMKVLIDAPYKNQDLILVSNAVTGEVEGFAWGDYWFIRPSASFGMILKGHQAKSKDEAITHVKTFAKLLAFTSGNKIGSAKIKDGKMRVELIRGKGVFNILEVEVNKSLRFDCLAIIQPNGKKLKYFV